MNKVQIITDSAADMTAEELKEYGVECVPMTVFFGEQEYIPGVNLTSERFYELLTQSETFPTTAQPAPADFEEKFAAARAQGAEVVAIVLSSALSGTCQSARIAAADASDVWVVDTLTVTAGQKLLVRRAAALRDAGCTAAQIAAELEELKGRIRILASMETLEYLYKGGRLSRVAAGVGTVAGVKPVITVTRQGEVHVEGKCIGVRRAMDRIVKEVQQACRDTAYPVEVLYSGSQENAVELAARLDKAGIDLSSCTTAIGPTVGSHVGPGAFAALYVEEK